MNFLGWQSRDVDSDHLAIRGVSDLRVEFLEELLVSELDLVVALIPVEVQGSVVTFWNFNVKVPDVSDMLHGLVP